MRYIFLLFCVFFGNSLYAQTGLVTGKILESQTKAPISESHIFIPGTTFQTFTDSLGEFNLKGLPIGTWEMAVMKEGFQYQSKSIEIKQANSGSKLEILLEVKPSLEINDISEKRHEKLEEDFVKWLQKELGEKGMFIVVNPNVLSFRKDLNSNFYWVDSDEGLLVQNLKTSYLMTVYFRKEVKMESVLKSDNFLFSYLEMQPGSEFEKKMITEHRIHNYENSTVYELRKLLGTENSPIELETSDQPEGQFLLRLNSPIEFENGSKSIAFKNNKLMIRANGAPVNPENLIATGFSDVNYLFKQLPLNFDYDKVSTLAGIERTPEALQEKVFLHTDKDIYLIGEELYFKAYLQLGNPLLLSEASKVLHIEIVDPSGYSMVHKVFPLVNGVVDGKIFLSPELNTKDFIVKAYTLWGANYGVESEFYKPIQVLGSLWETNNTIQETRSEGVILFADKEAYQSKDSVTLNVMVNNTKGAIAAANLSLSVVKKNGVYSKNLSKENYVTYFSNDLNSTSADTSSFSFEKEFGLTLKGQIVDKKDQLSKSKLEVLIDGLLDKRELSPDQNGQFLLKGIHKEGEFSVLVKGKDAKGLRIEGVELGLMRSTNHPDPLTLEFPSVQTLDTRPKGVDSLMSAYLELREGEILLDAVEVEDVKESGFGTMPYGKPHQVLEMDGVFLSGDTQQFIYSFSNRVGLKVAGVPPMILNQRGAQPGPPLILLNGSPITSITGPTIGSDPGDEQFRALQSINVFNIERVEVIKSVVVAFGDAGKYGVINIITKTSKDRENDVNTFEEFKLMGLEQSAVETINNIDSESQTIFWDPNVRISSNQTTTSVKFKLPDDPGPFWVLVNGLNSSGEPVSGRFLLNQNQMSDN